MHDAPSRKRGSDIQRARNQAIELLRELGLEAEAAAIEEEFGRRDEEGPRVPERWRS